MFLTYYLTHTTSDSAVITLVFIDDEAGGHSGPVHPSSDLMEPVSE